MRQRSLLSLLAIAALFSVLAGCGDPVTKTAASRGRFRLKSWLRYEFRQMKTFSYGSSQVKENKHVIGYEPSWLIYDSLYQTYPFELLSDLVIGEYDVNPGTGFPRNDSSLNAFREKNIIQTARSINGDLNLMLAVTDYGDFGYRTEFISEVGKKNLINSLDLILDDINFMGGGDVEEWSNVGLLLDFPSVPWNLRYEYVEFLARLKKDLNNTDQGKSCLIYVVLPPVDLNRMYQDSVFALRMRENTDLFVLRAHNNYDYNSPVTKGVKGPMLPVNKPDDGIDIDSVVNYYTIDAKIKKRNLVVEFPYYGKLWTTDSTESGSRPFIPLNEIYNSVEAQRLIDTTSLCWIKKVDTLSYYYHDTLSLDIAYSWIERKNLAGISLYGLGYGHGLDNERMEQGLWESVALHFAEPAPRLLFPAIGYLLLFIATGIIASAFFHWEVRYALRERKGKLWYYIAFLFFVFLAVVMCALPVDIIPILWKIISIVIVLFFPLGRKAIKFFIMAR